MLKVLVKKQLAEVFKKYFYDAKKNKMRSRWAIAAWFLFFFVIMAGLIGGTFAFMSVKLCKGLAPIGMGWLYFLLMSGIAIVLGAFGSIFNTYSSLYLSKDNDLLLSMPIPVSSIIASRLISVYLLGTMYASAAFLPALIVYWVTAGITAARMICGIVLYLIITIIVLLLSCLLGWIVAKISLKLKNKSFITVLASLAFIGAYYFFYFKANNMVKDMIVNAVLYGEKIKGTAYWLYRFGRIGEGDFPAAAIFSAVTALLCAAVWMILSRSFLDITTSEGKTEKVRYVEKTVKERSAFESFLRKEFGRFTSSANYMLNCGLGILLMPAFGVLILINGKAILAVLNEIFTMREGFAEILVCTALCALVSMINPSAPSVSLEGKNIWIPQSLPIHPKTVLRAKAALQLILSVPPMLFAVICVTAVMQNPIAEKLMICLVPLLYTVFCTAFGSYLGVKMPIINWTNETTPIKQSGFIAIAIFGSWAITVLFAAFYLWFGYKIGITGYLTLWAVLLAAFSLILFRWLETKGSRRFEEL